MVLIIYIFYYFPFVFSIVKWFLQKKKTFEGNLNNSKSKQDHLKCRRELNYIIDQKLEGTKIRSKFNLYEDGENSSNFFLKLEKNQIIQNQICSLIIGEKEVKDTANIA